MRSTLRTLLCAMGACLFALPAFALNATDAVKINEVSYDPGESPEDPYEYVELYNAGGSTVFLDGAVISDEGNNGTAEAIFQFPGTPGGTTIPLAAGAYLLVVSDVATGNPLNADYECFTGGTDTDDGLVPNLTRLAGTGVDLQLGNTGDGVVLATGTGITGSTIPCNTTVDGVSFESGGTGDTTPMSSTVCTDPAPHAGYANTSAPLTILTLQRCPNGADTDNSAADFSIANRTPKAANGCSTLPPVIASLQYSPCYVTANQPATISATVTDDNNDITSVRVYYKLDTATLFDSVTATLGMMNVYSATIPGKPDQSHVQYYMGARDAAGNLTKNPSSAPSFLRSYRVGLQTIASLQVAGADSCGSSTEVGKAVNVVGVCTHRAFEYSDDFFYIQQGIAPNSGIKVFAPDSAFVPNLGDSVRVSGFISEFRCQTEVEIFSGCTTTLGVNRKVRARQLTSVGDIPQEQYESMLVTVAGPIDVVTSFIMRTAMSFEFKVSDGGGTSWVGDDTFFPDGIGYVVPDSGATLDAITGIVAYRFNTPDDLRDLRLEPRRDNDVDQDYTGVGPGDEIGAVPMVRLAQNRPNPFNPSTTIEFTVPKAGTARVEIFDAQGKVVRVLAVREYSGPTRDRVVWNGARDDGSPVSSGLYFYKLTAGDQTATRKMLLLK